MGLDIYAGTLTRYYAHNWKTAAQQWAEENGFAFHRIAPGREDPSEEEELSPAEIQKAVEDWREQILAAVSQPGKAPYTPWPEDNESPYFTDKPDWDALGAMLLTAACHTYREPIPSSVPKGWDFMEHPLIRRLSEDGERVWSLFRGAVCWIPLPDGFLFQGPLPTGGQTVIATTAALHMELDQLNAMAWQADEAAILGWSKTEGYPVEGSVGPDGVFTKADIPEQSQYDTESLAKFAFSIFYQAVQFSEEGQTPILLDY
ncbi:MAG: hypothetical protein HFE86_05755 [Clostridiales bacterium]|nr:hypothetical protein [Clostridiales bacterium]